MSNHKDLELLEKFKRGEKITDDERIRIFEIAYSVYCLDGEGDE